ncbi:MAG: flagellar protein FliT [Betaproteobacteria bacterium HGW-Betaproteobacteria-22]|nr:MAG: flagellar protein FliT [Betaproteobacteria bacterium HGW-Betaproteobacteria-22]
MEYQDTVVLYESVASIMQQMLHAARMQDWDRLTELEKHCAQHIATLKTLDDHRPLPRDALKRKVASIKSILADDREIRHLVSPWMARLNAMMQGSYASEQRLMRAYGT